jgi:hypothetical protein
LSNEGYDAGHIGRMKKEEIRKIDEDVYKKYTVYSGNIKIRSPLITTYFIA